MVKNQTFNNAFFLHCKFYGLADVTYFHCHTPSPLEIWLNRTVINLFKILFLGTSVKHGETFPLSTGWTVNFSRRILNNQNNHEILLIFTPSIINIRSQNNFYAMDLFKKDDKHSRFRYACYAKDSPATWNFTDRDGVQSNLYCNGIYYDDLVSILWLWITTW